MCSLIEFVDVPASSLLWPSEPQLPFIMDAEEDRECREFARADTDDKQ